MHRWPQSMYASLKHDGTVPTCFNQSKASISFDYIPTHKVSYMRVIGL